MLLLAAHRQRERPVGGIPELGKRRSQIRALLRRALDGRNLLLTTQSIVQIGPDPLKLGRPRAQRIGLVGVEHVAHCQSERVQVVLHSQ